MDVDIKLPDHGYPGVKSDCGPPSNDLALFDTYSLFYSTALVFSNIKYGSRRRRIIINLKDLDYSGYN